MRRRRASKMSAARIAGEETRRRAIFLLILGIAVVIPSLAWPGGEGRFSFRPVAIQVVALGLLLLMAPRVIPSREAVGRFLKTGPNLPILLFLVWSLISCLESPNRAYGFQQLAQLAGGAILYFAVVYRVCSRSQLMKLVAGLAGAVIVSVLLAGALLPQRADGRAAAGFGDCQLYASFLVLMLPLMFVLAQADENRTR